ncbi:MAG: helix-turn-helix domain-containing protein [Bacteroidota bacterium]
MPANPVFNESEVLDKARDLFWERGYHATSISDLEKALGLSRSSLYNSFGGKRALYDLTLARYRDDSFDFLKGTLSKHRQLRAGLKDLFAQAILSHSPNCVNGSKGCYIGNATTELASSCSDALKFVAGNREQFIDIMGAALQKSPELELDRDQCQDWANYLFVIYNGLQVVLQTGIERDQLQASIFKAVDGLPWKE